MGSQPDVLVELMASSKAVRCLSVICLNHWHSSSPSLCIPRRHLCLIVVNRTLIIIIPMELQTAILSNYAFSLFVFILDHFFSHPGCVSCCVLSAVLNFSVDMQDTLVCCLFFFVFYVCGHTSPSGGSTVTGANCRLFLSSFVPLSSHTSTGWYHPSDIMTSWSLFSLCSSSLCLSLFSPAINVCVIPTQVDLLTTDPGAFSIRTPCRFLSSFLRLSLSFVWSSNKHSRPIGLRYESTSSLVRGLASYNT